MPTDTKNRSSILPTKVDPFSERIETEDARGNGVEVVPAQPNKVPYVEGYQLASAAITELRVGHSAGSADKASIGTVEYMTAKSVTPDRRYAPPLTGVVGQNIGVHSTAAGHVEALIWGYYADP